MRIKMVLLTCLLVLAPLTFASAFELKDPTEGEPFFPWLWNKQFKPTITGSLDDGGWVLLGSGVVSTIAAAQYDGDVATSVARNPMMTEDTANVGAELGSGPYGIMIALGQLVFDQKNGLAHARAIALTSFNHITVAAITHRTRPSGIGTKLSFPSGHASSAFATATSLAYAYGPIIAMPAYGAAFFISASRINNRVHWFSDTVAAAAIGMFWARASARAAIDKDPSKISFTPALIPGGALATLNTSW